MQCRFLGDDGDLVDFFFGGFFSEIVRFFLSPDSVE